MEESSASQQDGRLVATTPFSSGRRRTRILTFLLAGFIFTALLSIFSDYLQLRFLDEAADFHITAEDAEANDLRQTVVVSLRVIFYIASAVAFLFWIHRAYSKLPALGNPKAHLSYSPTWAVLWFLIPLANLIMPYLVTKEIWNKSDPAIRTEDDVAFTPPESPLLLTVWWLAWITSNVFGNLVGRFIDESATPETLAWATKIDMISLVISILAATLAILVVNSIQRRQERRSAHVSYESPAPPPPPLHTAPPATS